MNENKPGGTEKYLFEYHDKLKFEAYFCLSGLSTAEVKNITHYFSIAWTFTCLNV